MEVPNDAQWSLLQQTLGYPLGEPRPETDGATLEINGSEQATALSVIKALHTAITTERAAAVATGLPAEGDKWVISRSAGQDS